MIKKSRKINIEELKDRIPYEELYTLYITQNKTKNEIKAIYNLTDTSLLYILKEYDISKLKEIKNNNYIEYNKLKDLYIIQNLSIPELMDILNTNKTNITRHLTKYNITKSKELKQLCEERLYFNKTGYKTHFENPEVLNKIKHTNFIRYGTENIFASEYGKQKIKETNLERYGVKNPSQLSEIKNKVSNTKLKHFNDSNYNNREKAKVTTLERYGTDNYTKTEEYNIKTIKTNLERYGTKYYTQTKEYLEKVKQTNLEKYRVENIAQVEKIKAKIKSTMLKKYGVENPSQVSTIQDKKFKTMHKNNSFNISKPEEEIATLLTAKFLQIKRQYKSEKYPFACDFYVPELDLYIEYQGTWTHGKEPYNEQNKEHMQLLLKWREKANTSKFYNNAINVWTIKDPLKRKIAKENGLNWLEFFTFEQFLCWFNNI